MWGNQWGIGNSRSHPGFSEQGENTWRPTPPTSSAIHFRRRGQLFQQPPVILEWRGELSKLIRLRRYGGTPTTATRWRAGRGVRVEGLGEVWSLGLGSSLGLRFGVFYLNCADILQNRQRPPQRLPQSLIGRIRVDGACSEVDYRFEGLDAACDRHVIDIHCDNKEDAAQPLHDSSGDTRGVWVVNWNRQKPVYDTTSRVAKSNGIVQRRRNGGCTAQ